MIYYGIVEKDDNSAFGVTFPDLPGCFSAADEEADIVGEAQVALSLYASDEEALPPARSFDVLRNDPEVRRALAAGGFLIAVPLALSDKKVRTNVMLDRGLLDVIDRQAEAAGMSRSEYLSRAAERQVHEEGGVWIRRGSTSVGSTTVQHTPKPTKALRKEREMEAHQPAPRKKA